jgi:uncharacterized protein
MNIVFDIAHPAHINFFKNAINQLQKDGHHLIIFGLRRGKVPAILFKEFPGFKIKIIGRHRNNFLSIIFEANILKFISLFFNLMFKKVDIGVSVGSFTLGACLKLLGKKNIQFDDDPESSQNLFLEKITADELHIPPLFKQNKKFIHFNALKEWAYLSPNYYEPNVDELSDYGIEPYNYLFMREVSPGSLNYLDQGSYTVASFANKLDRTMKVLLSLEDKSKIGLYPKEWILLNEPVMDIHSLMYYSMAVISSGDSMAREGAMLGRPSIYCGKRIMRANKMMQEKGIFFQLTPDDVASFLKRITSGEIITPAQSEFRSLLLNEWEDVTEHIINSIERMVKGRRNEN